MIDKIFPFLKQRIFCILLKKQGFNLVELLTTITVAGVLTTVGVRSYQSQTNKTRSAEAKSSLSSVYTAEQSFHDTWNTYHENLIAIGAVPSGAYYYDVGFGKGADLTDTDTYLSDHPLTTTGLNIGECTNIYEICEATTNCKSATETAVPAYAQYSKSANCQVTGCTATGPNPTCLKDYANSGITNLNKGAGKDAFTAIAVGNLKGTDVWSIDQLQTVTHELDGTQ